MIYWDFSREQLTRPPARVDDMITILLIYVWYRGFYSYIRLIYSYIIFTQEYYKTIIFTQEYYKNIIFTQEYYKNIIFTQEYYKSITM